MFLFENYTYNSKWAIQYYENFYNASHYIAEYLNEDYKDNGVFLVAQRWSMNHSHDTYEVSYINKANIFDSGFPEDAYIYAYNKLLELGDVIDIKSPKDIKNALNTNIYNKLLFKYNVDIDERRWNIEHENINKIIDSTIKNNCNPTLESWLYMLNAYANKKNPERLFAKEKDLFNAAQKYIIAIKLNWDDCEYALSHRILNILERFDRNTYPRFLQSLTAYANTIYEISDDIKELIESYKSSSKHIGEQSIPTILLNVAKALDNNNDVARYEINTNYYWAIDIECINGNVGRMYIDKVDTSWNKDNKFYRFGVTIKGINMKEEKSNSQTLKDPEKQVDACVRAIYKKDPQEIHNIIIKVK